MTDLIMSSIYYFGLVSVCACLLVCTMKFIWNFGLPYAMIKANSRGWSIFPLIEIVPLILAIFISFLTAQEGMLAPFQLAIWGFGAILASYIHFALVAILYGSIQWLRDRKASRQTNK